MTPADGFYGTFTDTYYVIDGHVWQVQSVDGAVVHEVDMLPSLARKLETQACADIDVSACTAEVR